jgi:glucose uptake protein GlcU
VEKIKVPTQINSKLIKSKLILKQNKYKRMTMEGWIAAIASCLSFGSFAVPIKSKACQKIDVDPLVFQTYKTAMCLLTSWIVIPFLHTPIYVTPWGLVSGLFWVPAGVAAIFAVKNAGLAVSQGLWSSIIVIVSFTWGIFVFQEEVKSIIGALVAVGFMIVGLWGMSFYSSPPSFQNYAHVPTPPPSLRTDIDINTAIDGDFNFDAHGYDDDDTSFDGVEGHISTTSSMTPMEDNTNQKQKASKSSAMMIEKESNDEDNFLSNPSFQDIENLASQHSRRRATLISRRTLGLLSAIFNGCWGGSIMVPMHYAPPNAHGMGYVISFAIGATIITIGLWIVRFSYYYFYENMTLHGSYHSLPSFHFRIMWKPGGIAGLLWSIGNLSSMISVQHLGEGVGYSLTQASMLISGMWGIFYFKEVEGVTIRIKWFLSALVTILGILLLSFEHVNDE